MPEKYYSEEEAAQKIGVSKRTIRRYIDDGRFENLLILPAGKYRHVYFTAKTFATYKQKYGPAPDREKRTYNRRIGKYKRKSEK